MTSRPLGGLTLACDVRCDGGPLQAPPVARKGRHLSTSGSQNGRSGTLVSFAQVQNRSQYDLKHQAAEFPIADSAHAMLAPGRSGERTQNTQFGRLSNPRSPRLLRDRIVRSLALRRYVSLLARR